MSFLLPRTEAAEFFSLNERCATLCSIERDQKRLPDFARQKRQPRIQGRRQAPRRQMASIGHPHSWYCCLPSIVCRVHPNRVRFLTDHRVQKSNSLFWRRFLLLISAGYATLRLPPGKFFCPSL